MATQSAAGLQLLQLAKFTGLNRRGLKFLIADEQAQDLLNFTFDQRGALVKISGYVQWNAASLGASGMLGGDRFYKTGADPQFVQAHNGKLYKGVDATKTFVEIAAGLSTTAQYRMKSNRDLLFMLNGSDENKKWDGTTVNKMGVVAPTTAPTAADNGAGNLNGTYSWKVTFVAPTVESNGSPTSNTLSSLVNRQVLLTSVPVSSDTQVTKRRIYRTLAGGSDYKFVGEINDNTTTTFNDNVADASIGVDIPTGKNPPQTGKYIEAFKNRLWIAGDTSNPRRLYFSEYFEPEAWPTTFFVDIPMDPGDVITGIKVLGDVLIVYGHNTPFLVIGETPFDFTVKRSFAHTGTESDRTVVLVENAHIYLSRFGVYAFNGAVSRLLSDDIEPLIREISPLQLGNSAAAYHERRKVYRLGVSSAATNNREYIYDLRVNAWTTSDRTIGYYHHLDGPGDQGQLFTASPTAGVLNEEDTGTTANGASITCRWKSKAYALGFVDLTKVMRHCLLWLEPNQDTVTLAVVIDDNASKQQTYTILSSSVLSLVGFAIIGTSVISGPGIVRVDNTLAQNMLGRYVEVIIESTGTNTLKIYSVELSYRTYTNLRIR